MTDIHDTADLVSKALCRAWQLGQTYWQQADSEYQSHWKKADATQDTFNQLVEDTRAAILAANSSAQPAPSVPREAIEKMLTQLMDIAVSNGANSISMPDEYVEVAAWLCGIPAQPTPSVPDDVLKDAERYRFLEHLCATGSYGGIISRKAVDAAMLAAAKEAKP